MIQIVPRRLLPAAGPARPGWFVTLFLTDMWERFSFYGMQAILVLYAAAPASRGGLGLPKSEAAALFGVYMATLFMLALPGGWLGDRVLGERRAVVCGAATVAAGHYCMAVPVRACTFLGLALIALGTGVLKPNMSGLLTRFYGPGQEVRREAAFAVFYMSIQVSALLAPLVTGYLGERVNWHAGFAAAGVGMTFGVAQFVVGSRTFGEVGGRPARPATRRELRSAGRVAATVVGVAALLLGADAVAGTLAVKHVLIGLGLVVMVVPPLGYLAVRRDPALTRADRTRLGSFLWLFLAASLFWMVVGQAGSLLNLFADRHTDRDIAGFTVPAAWFQSLTPLFILLAAPLFAAVALRLGARAGVRRKVCTGLALAGGGFLVMSLASMSAADGVRVTPLWLVAVYLLHACGEIVLGPSGMSAVADAAPVAFRGRVMGLWWLFSALGMAVGSRVVLLSDVLPAPLYYLVFGLLPLLAAAALAGRGRRARVLASSA
ncbi:peptide MFS transporter [Actinomadura rupiterrae]|uniref:peptide MFS transporter n=1 Tax=Actinomadura rupiterrae TaxID=559627 RepID=UPI0020A25954|nr:oligopeptide:H+ symporter [Actinomadura rupiterrae]MCP2341050.1 POT family proton-dependent oligopeptide transporter [Actinomadura rupiterrae]